VRAERQRQTRERIVAATLALHAEVGPRRTTVAEIARRAGVQRLTVYNTFPDSAELFAACQKLFLVQHPPPPGSAGRSDDPLRALRATLRARYAWYRANRALQEKVHRDRHLIPELDTLMARTTDARLQALADSHVAALRTGRRPRALRPIVRLAFRYVTWEQLADEGMTDGAIARLMTQAIAGVLQLHSSAQRTETSTRPF
jgi:AcrR family transcriptional regulator